MTYNPNYNYLSELKRKLEKYKDNYDVDALSNYIGNISRQLYELKQQYYRIPNNFIETHDPEHWVENGLHNLFPNNESISSSESSTESLSESSNFNPRVERRQYHYKIIIDTHGCVHRNKKVTVPFPFGSLKYYAEPGQRVVCKNNIEEIISICEGKHKLHPYDTKSSRTIKNGEPHIEVDDMRFSLDTNSLRNVFVCHEGEVIPLWGESISDVFNSDGTISIKGLFEALISEFKYNDKYQNIPLEQFEIIISSCMTYCGENATDIVRTHLRGKTHKKRSTKKRSTKKSSTKK